MNKTTTLALVELALETLRGQCYWQPWDHARQDDGTEGHEETRWETLEARARAADPCARWLVRLVFVEITGGESATTEAAVIGFETAPSAEEMRAGIRAEAERRGLLNLPAGLVYNITCDEMTDLADLAPAPYCDVTATRTVQSVPTARPMGAARAMLARAGQRTATARRRLVAA